MTMVSVAIKMSC